MLILIAAAASVCDAAVDRLLATHPTVIEYCERCGDKAPGLPHVADARPIDLETTFVKTSDVRYQNLALLAGCTTDVQVPTLKVLDETPTGVLIVPDTAPVDVRLDPVLPVVHIQAASTRSSTSMMPFVVAGAGGGGATLCVIAGLAVYRRRKRAFEARKLGKLGGPTP
jgi:hypothetical protein